MFRTHLLDAEVRKLRERLEAERRRLFEVTCRTLAAIRQKYGIAEAYILGSLAEPHRWREGSDIDVAVSGCSQYVLEVMREIEEATGREVDVIDLDAHPRPESVKRRGVKVYGEGSDCGSRG